MKQTYPEASGECGGESWLYGKGRQSADMMARRKVGIWCTRDQVDGNKAVMWMGGEMV